MEDIALQGRRIASPKLTASSAHAWYDYYAGYSSSFAEDAIHSLLTEGDSKRVLDPWNGSGTTSVAASLKGHEAIGVDRNPALVVIAKGRHLPASVLQSLVPLVSDVTDVAERRFEGPSLDTLAPDELSAWFAPTAQARLRSLERAIDQVLVGKVSRGPKMPVHPKDLSTLAAFFYCALFTVVRKLTVPFRASNPTWIRRPKQTAQLLVPSWEEIAQSFVDAVTELSGRLRVQHDTTASAPDLRVGAAERINLARKAHLTLGSPPYCTRIDYVIATQPELAVLGYSSVQIQRLRRTMLGSPLTERNTHRVTPPWGPTATGFLGTVHAHPSKASQTYYFRYYNQYLRGLHASVERLHRVTRRDGTVALVVQDSYYKEAHFDLPQIVMEIGERLGRQAQRIDFSVPRTMAAIHPGARAYRDSFRAVESLVVLRPCASDAGS